MVLYTLTHRKYELQFTLEVLFMRNCSTIFKIHVLYSYLMLDRRGLKLKSRAAALDNSDMSGASSPGYCLVVEWVANLVLLPLVLLPLMLLPLVLLPLVLLPQQFCIVQ